MNLDPWVVLSAMIIGAVGVALLVYGKKECSVKCMGTGIAMSVFPCFIHSLLLMWLLAGACLVVLVVWSRLAL